MGLLWFQGKCPEHGGWDRRVYGIMCPICTGKIGRKKQPKPEKDDE